MLRVAGSMTAAVNSGMNSQARAAKRIKPRREAGRGRRRSASSTRSTTRPRRQGGDHDESQQGDELDAGIEALQQPGPASELVGGQGVLDPGGEGHEQTVGKGPAGLPAARSAAAGRRGVGVDERQAGRAAWVAATGRRQTSGPRSAGGRRRRPRGAAT